MSLYDEIINGNYKNGKTKVNYIKRNDDDDEYDYNNLYSEIKNGDYNLPEKEYQIPDMSDNELYNSIINGTYNPNKTKIHYIGENSQDELIKDVYQESSENQVVQNPEKENILDNTINNISNENIDNENKKSKELFNVIVNNNKPNSLKTEQEKQQDTINQNYRNQISEQTNTIKNPLAKLGKIIQNLFLGATSNLKQGVYYSTDTNALNSEQKAQQINNINKNPNISEIVKQEYINQETKNDFKRKNKNETIFFFKDDLEKRKNQKILVNKETEQKIDKELNDYKDSFGNLELNPARRNLSDSIQQDQIKIQNNINQISGNISKKIAELSPSIGNSLAGAGISFINPYLGTSYFIIGAMGSYEYQAKQIGMTDEQARDYGLIMGYMEGATEMVGIDKFLKMGKAASKGAIKEALKNLGLDIIDNAIQEAVIDPIDETAKYLTSRKTENDYSTIEGGKKILSHMFKDGFDGALTALITGGVGLGISSSINIYDKIKNGEIPSQNEIKETLKDIQNSKKINILDMFKKSFNYQEQKIMNNDGQTFTYLNQTKNGDIIGINQALGKKMNLENDNLTISPAVVLIDNHYNIIDSSSGLKLDTTLYNSIEEAEKSFNDKIKNIDKATENLINQKVTETQLSTLQHIEDINSNIYELEQVINNQMKQQDSKIVNNNIEYENSQDNRLYSPEEAKQILKNNNINYDLKNRYYLGQELDNIIKNNLSDINQNNQETNLNNNSTNVSSQNNQNVKNENNASEFYNNDKHQYAVSNINEIESEINKKKSYTLDEIGEIWSNIEENTYDITLNDDNYVSLDENNGNLEAVLYDSETDEEIKRVSIKATKNGNYTSTAINNAIKEVSTIADENRPIKGQVDIEGNEVRSMKKHTNNNQIVSDEELSKSIENFKNAKNNIDRKDIVNIANALNVFHKNNQVFIDKKMYKLSGNNKNSQITKIIKYFNNYNNKKELRELAGSYAFENYKNEQIKIKDINIFIDMAQKGLKKTFNIKQSEDTLQSAPVLPNMIKESIYLNSSIDLDDNNLVYHYFYAPVQIDTNNSLSMITIKEIVTDKKSNPKFYYHDIREINSKELLHAMPHKKVSNMLFEETPLINNSISQNNENVKNENTIINNKDMQNKENNSSDDNIRSMKSNTVTYDSEGKKLTKAIQEYFKDSKVRDDKGNLIVIYHGTNNIGFTKFNRNMNFYTDNKEVAKTYTSNNGIYEGYLNIKNPIIIDAKNEVWSKIAIDNVKIDGIDDIKDFLNKYGGSMWNEKGHIRTSTADLASSLYDYIEENSLDKDGIIIKNIYDEGANSNSVGNLLGTDYITFKSNQFKNITNKKPTSNDDIRYMKKDTTKTSNNQENTLIAQHNVTEEKLLEALELDGLPVPSIAITKGDTPILGFGNITLLFDKETINPTDKRNVIYNSDIYSTRKPVIANSLDKSKIKAFRDKLVKQGASYGYISEIENSLENNDERQIRRNIEYAFERADIKLTDEQIDNYYQEALNTIKEKRVIKPDIDPYTPSGNRRTIEQISLPYTLDNIVKIMTKKNTKGSEHTTFLTGLGEVRANASQQLKSIRDMHNKEQNIVTEKEMLKVQEELRDKFHDIIDKISKYDKIDRIYGSTDSIANALNETAKAKNITKEVLDNELDFVSIRNVPDNVLKEAVDFLNSLKDVPTEYFESKPQRAVGFDEVHKAIVPENTSKEIINKLKEKGVKIEYYKSENERKELISNSDDIRFLKKGKSKNNHDNIPPSKNNEKSTQTDTVRKDKGQRNAERETNYIEQEIQRIEKFGNWDDSIPVTKLTDIRKTIENYLGLGIKKGHFKQKAFGIYKSNRDVIRTKEFKDMDTILHETGHALDLGNRLNVDKNSIKNELLRAVNNLGGYENETIQIQMDEGFAEIIREYSIVPERAKNEYPQAVAVIEKIRQADQSFDKFISKVQEQTYNYIHQNPKNRVLSNVSIGEQTDKAPLSKEWIKQETMRNIWDKDYAVKSMVNEMAKIKGKTTNQIKASENAYYLTRLASGVHDKIVSMLSNGYIDEKGVKRFTGLNKIGEILGEDSQRYNDLRAYLVARRDTDYKAKTLKTGIRSMDSKSVIEQFKNDTQIQESAKVVYDTLDGVLQYAVDNHLIDQQLADKLKESNAFYVPMQRVLENQGNKIGRKGAVADIIKQRTGSELDVKDVLENIVANSSNVIQQVENNNVLKAVYKQGEGAGMVGSIYDVIDAPMKKVGTATLSTWENELKNQGVDTKDLDLEKTIDIFAIDNKVDSQNLITSFINDDGKRVYLQFNDELLFNSLMNLDGKVMSQVLKISSKLNMPLRYGATMANLGFAIPNMISDTAQAAVYSTAGFIPIVDNVIGVIDVLAATNNTAKNFLNQVNPQYAKKINAMYQLYEQSGSTSATRMSQYRESTQKLMKDIYGTSKNKTLGINEKYKPLKRLLDILTYIPEISEQSTRFRVFEKNYDYYKNKGNSEIDTRILAALESRDATQDFGRTGNITREINQFIPFSAARVGSSYTFAEKIKANPKQIGTRIALLTALALAIKAIGYDDDEIDELIQRKKDDNFIFKIGDNIVTIKKPQGILRSIINLAEYTQNLVTGHIEEGKEAERLGEWINNAIMDNMPSDNVTGLVPNMVAPLIENAINKDFYYNTDIVKSYDLDLPNSEQYYDYNSQLAILLGNIFNYSPAKIDNLISGYFAGLGTTTTNIMDYISGKLGITVQKPEMGAESNTIGKRFIVNVNSNSASLDEIYNRKTELTKKSNSEKGLTSEEEKELNAIKNAISSISKVNKQIKEVKKDLTTSGKEKAEQIKELQKQRTDIAREALGKSSIYDTQEQNKSIEFYPTTNSLSKNNYKLELTSEMKKEYEQIAANYYSKYEKQGLYNEEKLKEIKSKAKDYAKSQMFIIYKDQLVKNK